MANYKPKKRKRSSEGTSTRQVKKQKMNVRQYGIIAVMILALIGLILPRFMNSSKNNAEPKNEPQFLKEGSLSFINGNTGASIKNIDIEVADDDDQRAQGLMWRRSMEDTQGMLFIMDENAQQGFYMRNTYIPLDIMFVGEDKKIVNIHYNTTPLSEKTLFSEGNAKYVVEVNGGYCQKYGIAPGDKIDFNLE